MKTPSLKSTKKQVFKAVLERPEGNIDATFVSIPFNVEEVFGTKGQVKVKALFDGHPYRGSLASMGTGCHLIIVRKDIRKTLGKKAGDFVMVEIEPDMEERLIELPEDLNKGLAKNAKAKKFFETLSYTNRKEYVVWITSAKRTETREKRLANTLHKLVNGKKNPAQK